ncbi:MAG: hypothetical protein F6K50_04955 [Moorea sp. SIO3I7]|nr:hypothetical protein [Moorena sp. SIO3I8]NEN94894.1 hypothetical protein [Moorena sp. SIO3I7]NEO10196.1 hypothetical protein [Moorena sp. SIO3I8]
MATLRERFRAYAIASALMRSLPRLCDRFRAYAIASALMRSLSTKEPC